MICCTNCFADPEIKAAIEGIAHKGDCPICGAKNTFIYDSDTDVEQSEFEELLTSIIEIYSSEDQLCEDVPSDARKPIEAHVLEDWNIFNDLDMVAVKKILATIIQDSLTLDSKLEFQNCAIKECYDEKFLEDNSIMGKFSWDDFKRCLRDENRFHSRYINLNILGEILKDTEIVFGRGVRFFRARLAKEEAGFKKKEMGAPPKEKATAGRANSKGERCLYLASAKETAVKEIRAGVFDYVTIGTFRLNRDIKVLDLSSITHNSPFYAETDKKKYYINEQHLKNIAKDLSMPMSSQDSDLEYLPTQYISDFAKFLGYDGVKYISTFDKTSFNLALFDTDACNCISFKTFRIGDLKYNLISV